MPSGETDTGDGFGGMMSMLGPLMMMMMMMPLIQGLLGGSWWGGGDGGDGSDESGGSSGSSTINPLAGTTPYTSPVLTNTLDYIYLTNQQGQIRNIITSPEQKDKWGNPYVRIGRWLPI